MDKNNQVSGIVEKIYRNNNLYRFTLKCKDSVEDEMLDVYGFGDVPDILLGDCITAIGEYENTQEKYQNVHNNFAKFQFKSRVIRTRRPENKEETIKFLSHVFNPAVHSVTYDAIKKAYSEHGEKLMDFLGENNENLSSLSSYPPAYKDKMIAAWEERDINNEALNILKSAGVSDVQSTKICDTYKSETLQKLKDNPYIVSYIPGIGFTLADKVANFMYPDKEMDNFDKKRILSVFHDVLTSLGDGRDSQGKVKNLKSSGDTFYNIDLFVELVQNRTNMSVKEIKEHIEESSLRNDGLVVTGMRNGFPYITSRIIQNEEEFIAFSIGKLSSKEGHSEEKTKNIVETVLEGTPFKSKTEEQKDKNHQEKAVHLSSAKPFSVLTGGPGTGKTTVTDVIVKTAQKLNENVYLVAPTGKAAQRLSDATNLKARTVHSLLGAIPDEKNGRSIYKDDVLQGPCLLVVDESSMLDTSMMARLFKALPANGRLLLVGDHNQLPSIAPGNILGDIVDSSDMVTTELTQVFRQAGDSMIPFLAKDIKQGQVTKLPKKMESGVFFKECESKDILENIIDLGKSLQKRDPDWLKKTVILTPVKQMEAGTNQINNRLSGIVNPDGRQISGIFPSIGTVEEKSRFGLKIGDKVMLQVNDDKRGLVNGDTGIIVDLVDPEDGSRKHKEIAIDFDSVGIKHIPLSEASKLRPDYACTIHKSQGSQYDTVIIPLSMSHAFMLDRSLLYTALTRASKEVFFIGEESAYNQAVKKRIPRNTQLFDFITRDYPYLKNREEQDHQENVLSNISEGYEDFDFEGEPAYNFNF